MICPECKENVDDRGAVAVEVSLSAGDEIAGSSSTARLGLCGACGKALLSKYTGFAVEAQIARLAPPR